jgi:stage II sporulation protein AA (anti-sigma F factor antagonist)
MTFSRNGHFAADVAQRDGHAVIVVRGEIDITTADEFRRAMETALQGRERIELDLRDTTFMDSTGLNVLVSAHRQLGQNREAIVVREPPRQIRTLLDVCGVAALFDIRPDGISQNGHSMRA